MKRNALKWSAGLIAGFATLLASCGTDYKIDTVLQLDKADVTAVAYPGVNMISWEPIASAQDYTVYVYEEDVYKKTIFTYGDLCAYDTDIVNDKEYTYYVQADSNTDPAKVARAVVVENSLGSDSVTAIVPPMGTKALDLVAYEDGYDGEVLTPDTEEDEYILTADRVKTFVDDASLYVSFPAKAYLNYKFKLYDKALDHAFYDAKNSSSADVYSNNVVAQKALGIPGAGKYQLTVEVTAKGTAYDKTELVIGEFEFAKLGLKKDSVLGWAEAYYAYSDISNNVVRIKLPRAQKADGSAVPSDWYKVYRSTDGAYETIEITSTKYELKLDSETGWGYYAYYLEDKVPDVNVSYTYYMVVTDGKSYSENRPFTLDVKKSDDYVAKSSIWGVSGYQDSDKDSNDISGGVEWTIRTSAKKTSDIKAYVILGESGRIHDTKPLASEIKTKGKDVSANIAATSFSNEFVVRTVLQGGLSGYDNTAYLLVVVNEAGKEEAVEIGTATSIWFK